MYYVCKILLSTFHIEISRVTNFFLTTYTQPKGLHSMHYVASNILSQLLILPFTDVTVLLSLTVFMNLVSAIMPTTSDAVPLIGNQKHYTSVTYVTLYYVTLQKNAHYTNTYYQSRCNNAKAGYECDQKVMLYYLAVVVTNCTILKCHTYVIYNITV